MSSARDFSDSLIDAYNRKDFDSLEKMIAPDIDFTHFNRDFVLNSRDALLDILRHFANHLMPDRHFDAPERVIAQGDTVIREAWYNGNLIADVPGFGNAGDTVRLKFCSIMRFNSAGVLIEWKDFG